MASMISVNIGSGNDLLPDRCQAITLSQMAVRWVLIWYLTGGNGKVNANGIYLRYTFEDY